MVDPSKDNSADTVECPERPSTPPSMPRSTDGSPLTPPPHVARKLTPLGKYSPRSLQDDLKMHQERRHSHLQAKISRLSMHSSQIGQKLDQNRRQRERKRFEFQSRLDRACRQRRLYLDHKRRIASATINSIQSAPSSASSNDNFMPERPTSRSEFLQSRVCLVDQIKQYENSLKIQSTTTFDDLKDGMREFPLFGDYSNTIEEVDLRSSFKLLMALPLLKAVAVFFRQIDLPHSPLYMARSFLYSMTMLIEENYRVCVKRTPTFLVMLENQAQDTVYKRLCEEYRSVRKRCLDNYYYSYFVKLILSDADTVWSLFESILNGAQTGNFADCFETFLTRFQTFRYLHLVRSIASLIEVNMRLEYHMEYLNRMRGLTDEPVILGHYDDTIKECKQSLESNKKAMDEFGDQLEKKQNIRQTLDWEKQVYSQYQEEVLSNSTLSHDNPLTAGETSESTALLTTSSFCGLPVSMVAPTFSLMDWRKTVIKVYLEYRKSCSESESKFDFLKAGHSGRKKQGKTLFTPASALGNDVQFLDYINYTYEPDVESLRAWLGLKTFKEGAIEAIERLSYLDDLNDIATDLAQMVEKCFYALRIVARSHGGKVVIGNGDPSITSLLSDAVRIIERINVGDLTLQEYLISVLDTLEKQLPEFLKQECQSLRQLPIDKLFIQQFIELIRDSLIFSVNRSIREGLNFVGSRALEFETELMEGAQTSGDVPLDLRFPVLYEQMLRRPAKYVSSEEEVYEYFNSMLIERLAGDLVNELEVPEVFQTFAIQLQELHGQMQSLIVLQSVTVLLATYFGEKRHLLNFSKLICELDDFFRGYFGQKSSPLNFFFKGQVANILAANMREKHRGQPSEEVEQLLARELDLEAIYGLVDQVAKTNIGSASSVRSVYAKTLKEIVKEYGATKTTDKARLVELKSRFYSSRVLSSQIDKAIADYYRVYDCIYEAYWDTLRSCCKEFEILDSV